MEEPTLDSRYKVLAVPEFKSAIPQHLLGKLSEQERYLVETLSKMEQKTSWLIVAAVESNRALIETEKRVTRLDRWKDVLTSRWSMIIAFVSLCAPVILKALFDKYFLKKP